MKIGQRIAGFDSDIKARDYNHYLDFLADLGEGMFSRQVMYKNNQRNLNVTKNWKVKHNNEVVYFRADNSDKLLKGAKVSLNSCVINAFWYGYGLALQRQDLITKQYDWYYVLPVSSSTIMKWEKEQREKNKKYQVELYDSDGVLKVVEKYASELFATRSGENWTLLKKGNSFIVSKL